MDLLDSLHCSRQEAAVREEISRLRRAEAMYRSIFENAVEGIFQTTEDGSYLTANPALARIYGYKSPSELVGAVTDIRKQLYVDPEQRARFVRLLQEHDTVSGFEAQVRRKDRVVIWISESARAVRDDGGALLYYEGTVEEITARKRAEEERAHAKAIEEHLRLALEQERDIVQTLTEGFLRKSPEIPGYGVAYYYRPCVEGDRAGGDWFDFLRIDDRRFGVVIGDVAGKGISAAVFTAKTKHMLQAYALEDPTPARVVKRLNRALYPEMSDRGLFVTLLYGLLDLSTGTFKYTNAGHPPPVLYSPLTGRCDRLAVTGGFVGGLRDIRYDQETAPLLPGSVMALFTDGIIEAAGHTDPYHDGGVGDLLIERTGESADAIAGSIMERSEQLAARNRRDDRAVIVLKRKPSDPDALP